MTSGRLQRALGNRVLQFFGFVSYPLYLMHENFMIAVVSELGRLDIPVPGYIYPLIPVAVLCAVAYVVARYVEPHSRQWLHAAAQVGRARTPAPFRRVRFD
jgi:peptidoglycan/LPS O-acetylase OafA/YrhL